MIKPCPPGVKRALLYAAQRKWGMSWAEIAKDNGLTTTELYFLLNDHMEVIRFILEAEIVLVDEKLVDRVVYRDNTVIREVLVEKPVEIITYIPKPIYVDTLMSRPMKPRPLPTHLRGPEVRPNLGEDILREARLGREEIRRADQAIRDREDQRGAEIGRGMDGSGQGDGLP